MPKTRALLRRSLLSGAAVATAVAVAAAAAVATITTSATAAAVQPFGIDVSSHNHSTNLDWQKVGAAGVSFTFIKATEGSVYTNPYFTGDWGAASTQHIAHGAYHFARPSVGSAANQASYFVSVAGHATGPGELPPVLDLEVSGGLTVSQLQTWVKTWLTTVASLTGRTPIIYCSPAFWTDHLGDSTAFHAYPLWIANWGAASPTVPGGWPTWTFWQSDDQGAVNGVSGNVDIDRFNGTPAQLATLANDASPQTPTQVGTTTTITPSATTVAINDMAAFTGVVSGADGSHPAGDLVTLWRRPAGASTYAQVVAAQLDGTGHYALDSAVTGTASYKVVYAGSATYAGSSSRAVTVTATDPTPAPSPTPTPTP
ncbi:MAG: GH25 family lysozyme, partial [Nocardioidaceae bacterium]